MAGDGRIFGKSGEVESLASIIKMAMQGIEATNGTGEKLLMTIDGSQSDALYQQAAEIVDYVKKAVQIAQEPLENVTMALSAYAALLASHGK